MGMFVRRANSAGAFWGAMVGMGLVVAVAFGTKISFFWYSPLGCLATFCVGWATSFLKAPPTEQQLKGLMIALR